MSAMPDLTLEAYQAAEVAAAGEGRTAASESISP
jgi:hypothetical protein